MLSCGIDSGSRTTKLVLLQDNNIIFSKVAPTGLRPELTAEKLLETAKETIIIAHESKLPTVVTGYGRNLIGKNRKKISEISCHARGVNYFFPEAESIIDIGGQDSKGILISKEGKVLDFVMNDRCAAGTGRFLEKVAEILQIEINELSTITLQHQQDLEINSTCVVFAESEMIGMITRGISPSDIAWSVHKAVARRTSNMVSSIPHKSEIIFTGGVALNRAMAECLSNELDASIKTTENPYITGALGAALFAGELNE